MAICDNWQECLCENCAGFRNIILGHIRYILTNYSLPWEQLRSYLTTFLNQTLAAQNQALFIVNIPTSNSHNQAGNGDSDSFDSDDSAGFVQNYLEE